MNIHTEKLPKTFGPYTLKQRFAGGGMAEIYLAEAAGPGGFVKPLVIKMIHRAYVNDERFASMFTEEAKILSSLTHGNIVPIFDFGSVEDVLYLAMEFIDGVDSATLMEVCRSQGFALPLEAALYIGVGTAAGLFHAHQAKDQTGKLLHIVHRDISPQNILLSRSGEVKLCDFGLATHSQEDVSTNAATGDEIKGKLKYLSPEQALGMRVGKRSDLFSLGVVLYELIAGHHPIPSGAGVSVLRELAGGAGYPPLKTAAPWISKEVCDIVDRALAFDKEKRFGTAEEMRAALAACLYRDYPNFSPETLAALVIRVQTAAEASDGEDDHSVARARIASFASSSRKNVSSPPPSKNKKSITVWIAASILAAFVLAGAGALLMHFQDNEDGDVSSDADPRTTPRPEDSFEAPPNAKSSKPDKASKTAAGPIREVADVTKDTAALETEIEGGIQSSAPSRANDSASVETQPKRPKGTGLLNINASPWADIEIDGRGYDGCPLLGVKLSAGQHKAVLRNSELGATKTRRFTIKPGETAIIVVDMESAEP